MTLLVAVVVLWLVWVLVTLLCVSHTWVYAVRRPGRFLQTILRPLYNRARNRNLESAERAEAALRQCGVPDGVLPDPTVMASRSTAFGVHKVGVLAAWAVPFALVLLAQGAADPTARQIAVVYAMLIFTTALALVDARATARSTVFAATTRAAVNVAGFLMSGDDGTPETDSRQATPGVKRYQSLTQALSAAINTLCQAALIQATALSAHADFHARAEVLSTAQHLIANLKDERSKLLWHPEGSKARIAQLCAAVLAQACKPHEKELHSILVVDPAVLRSDLHWHPVRSPRRRIILALAVQTAMIAVLLGVIVALTHFQVPEAVVLLVFALLAALFARVLVALDLPATEWLRIARR
ncbi:hypothetical protein ACFV1L_08335 [Kitasatospora sp. NPDC059646]|uniref:hypothetical protein n=1 Tax=Kitasatospora sp. NPDC059646 TaxID=3346893 RepID=UPI0036A3C2A3